VSLLSKEICAVDLWKSTFRQVTAAVPGHGKRHGKQKFPTPFTHNRQPAFTKLKALYHKPHNAYYCEKSIPFLS
jgi:hypothetical protein